MGGSSNSVMMSQMIVTSNSSGRQESQSLNERQYVAPTRKWTAQPAEKEDAKLDQATLPDFKSNLSNT